VLLFSSLPLTWVIAIFVATAAAVWLTGTRLSYLADAISGRTGVGRAFMGLIFLAGITELPELVTTVYAAWKGSAALALNNMFGGIVMQTAILAVADAFVVHAVITAFPRKPTPILEGAFLILLMSGILTITMVGEVAVLGHLGGGALILAVLYILAIFILKKFEGGSDWRPIDLPPKAAVAGQAKTQNAFHSAPLTSLAVYSALAAAVILICGTMLVEAAEAIAVQTSLGRSFVGVTLLAAATSLPELSTTIAAVRMGAYTMAISNIFGSNLIMVLLILPADLFYRGGAILDHVDDTARLALVLGIGVTAIYVAGLLIKKKPRFLGLGLDSLLVLIVYGFSLFAFLRISR
jgi:cation:H+ antiporter